MNPLLGFYSIAVFFLFGMLHADEGSGLFSSFGMRWLYITYEFYFEPIYSSMHPMLYFVSMGLILMATPLVAIIAMKRKVTPA